MSDKAERNVGLASIVAGLGVVLFAVISGLTTTDGGVDWVGVVTIAAGLVLLVTGVFNSLHHGTA
jgi:uncharacterized protein YjeT (DUF2065 family)